MKEDNRVEQVPELSTTERIISLIGGTYLVYNALSKKENRFSKALSGSYLFYRGTTGHCPITHALGTGEVDRLGDINIRTSLTVNRPRNEVYEFWRELENLPLFMDHLEHVTVLDEGISEWVANVPGGMGTINWKSEIVEDVQGKRLGWQSLPDSDIENTGNISFSDAGKFGTEIHAVISYQAPLGTPGEGIAKLLNPVFEKMVEEDIKNFKKYMETGEVPTTAGQPSGKSSGKEEKSYS